jgi:leader peptidase (prepilin peptidase)/N-methyltransferase
MQGLGMFQLLGFVAGLCFGSFLNVCIVRVPRGESVVSPGSRCMACGHAVRWFDNIPGLSWLLLRGRCRDCRAAISWRYWAVELAVGLWFAITIYATFHTSDPFAPAPWTAQVLIELMGLLILGWILIGLIAIDWEHHRLPDVFTLSGIAIGIFLVCTQAIFLGPTDYQVVLNTTKQLRLSSPGSFAARGNVFLTGPESLIYSRLAAVAGAALILLLIRWAYKALRKREGLGLGDVKLLAMIAAFLGFWPAILTLFIGTLLASAYGLLLIVRRRADGLTRLPLGSFLGAAGLFAALFGNRIITWYTNLLH